MYLLFFLVLKLIYSGATTVADADVDDFLTAAKKTFGLGDLEHGEGPEPAKEVRVVFLRLLTVVRAIAFGDNVASSGLSLAKRE